MPEDSGLPSWLDQRSFLWSRIIIQNGQAGSLWTLISMTSGKLCPEGNVYIKRLILLAMIDKPSHIIKKETALPCTKISEVQLNNKLGIMLQCSKIIIYRKE